MHNLIYDHSFVTDIRSYTAYYVKKKAIYLVSVRPPCSRWGV